MTFPKYTYGVDVEELDINKFHEEMRSLSLSCKFTGIRGDEKEFTVHFDGEPTEDDVAKTTQVVKQHDPTPLEDQKQERFQEIDLVTKLLVVSGFEYQGVEFSLSAGAQAKLNMFYVARDLLTYPVRVNSKDDSTYMELADASEVEAIYAAAVAKVQGVLDTGTTEKTKVRSALSKEDLKLVVDSRLK